MITITIDPGMSGAVAWKVGDVVESYNAPYSTSELCDVLRGLAVQDTAVVCYVEAVHSFPGQGVTSTFNFGMGYGIIQGLLAGLSIPYQLVPPQRWMKAIPNLPKDKKDRKNALKEYSQRLYPHLKVTLKNADALAMLSILGE